MGTWNWEFLNIWKKYICSWYFLSIKTHEAEREMERCSHFLASLTLALWTARERKGKGPLYYRFCEKTTTEREREKWGLLTSTECLNVHTKNDLAACDWCSDGDVTQLPFFAPPTKYSVAKTSATYCPKLRLTRIISLHRRTSSSSITYFGAVEWVNFESTVVALFIGTESVTCGGGGNLLLSDPSTFQSIKSVYQRRRRRERERQSYYQESCQSLVKLYHSLSRDKKLRDSFQLTGTCGCENVICARSGGNSLLLLFPPSRCQLHTFHAPRRDVQCVTILTTLNATRR